MGCEPIEEIWFTMVQLRQKGGKRMTDPIAMAIQTIDRLELVVFHGNNKLRTCV